MSPFAALPEDVRDRGQALGVGDRESVGGQGMKRGLERDQRSSRPLGESRRDDGAPGGLAALEPLRDALVQPGGAVAARSPGDERVSQLVLQQREKARVRGIEAEHRDLDGAVVDARGPVGLHILKMVDKRLDDNFCWIEHDRLRSVMLFRFRHFVTGFRSRTIRFSCCGRAPVPIAMFAQRPLYPQQRTSTKRMGTSVSCRKETYADPSRR